MAEAVISVATEQAARPLVDSVITQLGYIWNYKTNFDNLDKQLQKLHSRREMVKHSVDEATRNGEEIEQHVVNWLDSVEKINAEATEIIEENNRANMRCFKSWCPDLKKRYQHSKKAAVKADDVSELERQGDFHRISYRSIPKETWHPSSKLYEDFESRRSTVDDILNQLRLPNVNIVGVHGMGGVGKTTLAREVGKQAEEQMLFDVVVFVEISEKPEIKKIQEAIADKLGLECRESSESGRARKLCERLKQEIKVLLILDNIWKGLDLETVGIPFGNDHPGCKLLLTARSIGVLSNDMNSLQNFSVGGLSEEEAWDLFKKVAGACIEQHNLQSLAFDVAERCGGLPIAIVTIAKALKDKQEHAWRNALRELQRPSSENLVGSVAAEAYSCIRLSYNHLETDELKSMFLLCSAMGFTSDASIEDLLRYGMGLRLFKTVYTMEEARDKVNTLVQKLKESSLLLDNPDDNCFSIHDVVRDVGRAIASKDHNEITVIDDVIPWEWKDKIMIKNCTSISLYGIIELPNKELDCPLLEFLYMESGTGSSKIPDKFFRGMPNLRVLHLMGMELSPLPSSLVCLVNLRALCLNCSSISDISFIEDMKDLEILVLSCEIEQLLKEIGELTELRVLDLSQCYALQIIPPSTISRLIKLEELYMPYEFNQWQVEGDDSGGSNVSLEELKDLSHLTTLRICIQDAKFVPKGLFSQKLQRYEILIGVDPGSHFGRHKSSRFLALEYDDNISLEDVVGKQLNGIEELHLIHGKQASIEDIFNMKEEVASTSDQERKMLDTLMPLFDGKVEVSNLKILTFRKINVEKMWHNQLSSTSSCFQNLTDLTISYCSNLKFIFSSSTLTSFVQLQCLEIHNCKVLEEIIKIDDLGNNVELQSLKKLSIEECPEIKAFIFGDKDSGNIICNFPSLEIFIVFGCPKMKIFSSIVASIPMLREMEVDFIIYDCKRDVNTMMQQIHEKGPVSGVGESSMDADDWRNQLQYNSRRRIINKIVDTLKRHVPFSGSEGLSPGREVLRELGKIAARFERKIYTSASSQTDYLRKISLKLLSIESKYETMLENISKDAQSLKI
ncbi:hypothetical protein ACOSP7_021288 [Xanthoceras sorbifolium]